MERVAWYKALAFCRWLSAKTGLNISLPTEQQWEKAARGTDGREYPWGAEFESAYCNGNGRRGLGETSAVGIYPQGQSPYGAIDMTGNVWEWCLNKHELSSMIKPGLSEDGRVSRRGSWDDNSVYLQWGLFVRNLSHFRNDHLGFRIVNCP